MVSFIHNHTMNRYLINGFVMATMLLPCLTQAMSLSLSEARLNQQLQQQFPMTKKSITISQPTLQLFHNYAQFCASFQYPLLKDTLMGCGRVHVTWNPVDSSLWIKPMALTELTWHAKKAPDALLDTVNQYVIPNLAPMKVYQNDSWIASQIDRIVLKPQEAVIEF